MKTLPSSHPAEILDISPEALEVANAYLTLQDTAKVSEELSIPQDVVVKLLGRREVKAYIDHVFMDLGFNNRHKMRAALDSIISKKFKDMDEAEVGSSKDIVEILTLSHKFTMEYITAQIALEKAKESNVKTQTNIQINDGGSNYGSLIERLINNENNAHRTHTL